MGAPREILVVGAGLAGSRCAEALRAGGFGGRLTVVGEEPVAPYERPALSKELLRGARSPDDLLLREPEFWEAQDISLVLGRRVARVDPAARLAVLEDGRTLPWDALVLATGARARRPEGLSAPGVHVLRTLAHAVELRGELAPGRHLAVVGAGFVGAEVASTALALGVRVTLIDLAPPLRRALGPEVSRILARRFVDNGATLRLGAAVAGVRVGAAGRVEAVRIEGEDEVRCDAVLVAVGAEPACPALTGAAQPQGGIATDAAGRTEIPGVYACGDAATAVHPTLGARLRVEHWTSAASQGQAVARSILGLDGPQAELPYFWTDQVGLRLQLVGVTGDAASVELEGEEDGFVARYRDRTGRPVAALAANRPRDVGALRRELASVMTQAA